MKKDDEFEATTKIVVPKIEIIESTYGGKRTATQYVDSGTLSGAYTDIDVNVPSGVVIKCSKWKVLTLITSGDGATSWSAAFITGATDSICTAQAFTAGTKGNKPTVGIVTSAVTKIRITPNSGTFSGGSVLFVVDVDEFEDLT